MKKEVKVVNINEIEWDQPVPRPPEEGYKVRRLITKGREGSDKLQLGIFVVDPGAKGFAWSPHYTEVYYLMRGKIRIRWNDKRIDAKEGDAVLFPEGFKYQVDNIGTETAEIIYVLTPPFM